jgi:N-acetylglucosamine malate deacetylase 2
VSVLHGRTRRCLPRAGCVLAVCAHPDDESFGLGAVLAAFSGQGARVRVLCFTHGEASTLGQTSRSLGEVRAEELRAAAAELGAEHAELLSYPDGNLAGFPAGELAALAEAALADADLLLVFDQGGITGHPDHRQATAAALLAARRHQLPVLAWALPEDVAAQLNEEFGTTFAGRPHSQLDIVIDADRARQRSAIACHASQSADNPVLWRRLELLGASEHLRWLT